MSLKSNQAVTVLFSTANASTGAAADATGTPTGTLYVNGTANGATVTVTNITTGVYKAALTLPALSAGDVVSLRVAATVSGVAGEGVVWQDVADTKRVSELNDISPAQVNAEADTAISDAALATAASLATVAGYVDTEVAAILAAVDTEVAAIKAKTDNLPAQPAAVGSAMTLANGAITAAVIATDAIDNDAIAANAVTELQSGLATAANLATLAGYVDTEVASILAAVDTEVAAIKAKTDNLPASPAATGDAMTLTAAYDAAKTAATQASVNDIPTNAELATALTGMSTLTAQQVWEYVTRELTSAGSGGATAQEVWEYATRELTGKTGFELSANGVTAVQNGLSTLTANQVNAEVVDVLRTDTIPDSYSADGAQPTMAQALLEIRQFMMERGISGTTMTVKKPDGSTTAFTLTMDDDTAPTSITRAS